MKYVIYFLSCILVGCAGKSARAPQVDAPPPTWKQIVSMNEGQTVVMGDAGFEIGFVIAVEDSRCPIDVRCSQQGRFLGKFFFRSLDNKQAFVYLMSTDRTCNEPECGPFVFTVRPQGTQDDTSYSFALEDVRPSRVDGLEILEPYRIQLRITNNP